MSRVFVQNGDHVDKGSLLAIIDTTEYQSNLKSVLIEIEENIARRYRLIAERDRLEKLPDLTFIISENTLSLKRAIEAERKLFYERREIQKQKKLRLNQKIIGLKNQIIHIEKKHSILQEELASISKLYKEKFIPKFNKNELEKNIASLKSEKSNINAKIAEIKSKISDSQIEILQINSSDISNAMQELKEINIIISKLNDKKITLQDKITKSGITSPIKGKVQEVAPINVGGIIKPGETLMVVVPEQNDFIVEARVDPRSIDQIAIGKKASIRFTSFSSSTTPTINALVEKISSNAIYDKNTNTSYYLTQLSISDEDYPEYLRKRLVSGMPAEVYIATEKRTVLSYFLKPLTDQISRSFNTD